MDLRTAQDPLRVVWDDVVPAMNSKFWRSPGGSKRGDDSYETDEEEDEEDVMVYIPGEGDASDDMELDN